MDMEKIKQKEKIRCIWSKSNTYGKEGKHIMPPKCKQRKCPGSFNSYKELEEFCKIGAESHVQ